MISLEQKLKNMKLPEIYYQRERECYLDPFRNKMIYITPEETVRQQIARYFVDVLKVPVDMVLIEEHLSHYVIGSNKRADIIIHKYESENETLIPCAIIECKADNVMIGDSAVKQAIGYADEIGCDYVFVSNGSAILAAKYDGTQNEYIMLNSLPTYNDMLNGKYEAVATSEVPSRIPYNLLEDHSNLYVGQEFGTSTPKNMLSILTNLWECLLDETRTLPTKKYKIFELTKDYGNRLLSYGNASGGKFFGVYRSFIIKVDGNDEFVSIGFSTYSTSAKPENVRTCINVAIDNERLTHHALQLVVDNHLIISGDKCHFYHSGRVSVGNIGSGNIDVLKQFVMDRYDKILINGEIYLGSLTNDRLLYLDDPEVSEFIENIISYALIRDKYREYIKKKNI